MVEGQRIGRYRIQQLRDEAGSVYLARDPNLARDVAVKLLSRKYFALPEFAERFRLQARTLASLENPAIVPIYDFGEDEGQPFLVMRYMAGGSLADKLRMGSLSLHETTRIFRRIALAMDDVHSHGIVHRDLKPDHILFDQHGNAFVTDFGLAKLAEATVEFTGIAGTPAYMSPEQIIGEAVDGRSDIYSLGIMLFQMLTGHLPFIAHSVSEFAQKHLQEQPPSILENNPALPVGCDRIIRRALQKDPEKRYQSVSELVTDLENLESQSAYITGKEKEEEMAGSLVHPSSLIKLLPIVLGLIAIIATGVIVFRFLFNESSSGEIPSPLEIAPAIVPQANDRFGELTISYPSYLRPVSSERIDVKLYIPPELASIEPVNLVRLPSTVTPTLKALNSHQTHILVSQQMAAVLTSPTFSVESIHPIQQQIKFDGTDTFWSWNITAPETLSTGILTLRIYKLYEEDADLTSIPPAWVGTIQVEVVQNTPTPSPTATTTPQPTPTPGLIDRATDSIADNSVTIVAGLLTLIGVVITAIYGPIIVERWKQLQKDKSENVQSIAYMLQSAAIGEIRKTKDVTVLKAWFFDEKRNKNRASVVEAIEERIKVLDSTERLD